MNRYSEIIDRPHHVSQTRARMSEADRAAQFSSFAALTGYEDCISEAGRRTDERAERSEGEMRLLDERLNILRSLFPARAEVSILYFKADKLKAGGAYLRHRGEFKRLDEEKGLVVFSDKTAIPMADVYEIEGEIFKK